MLCSEALTIFFFQPLTSSVLTRTFIQSVSSVSHSSSVSPSSTNTPTGGVSTGAIAGGIFAAILGCAGILAAVVYFLVSLI